MTKLNHLKKIASISEKLDLLGLYSYADIIDSYLKKIAIAPYDLHDDNLYPEEEGATPYVSPGSGVGSPASLQPETTDVTLSPYTRWKPSISDKKNYSTGEIPFKWGKYPGRYKSDIYYVSSDGPSNYIGKIQIPGDPFTYDLFGNKIKVVSAPYTKRHLIGKMIAKSDIPEKYLPSYKKPEEKIPLVTDKKMMEESSSEQAFVSPIKTNLDFYLKNESQDIEDLKRLYPNYQEEIFRLSRYSGIRSYLNEMRTEYPSWTRFTKEIIEDMDSQLMALDLLDYLSLHPILDDFFIDKLPEAIQNLKDSNSLL